MSCNPPSGACKGFERQRCERVRALRNRVGKQWKAVTIFIVGLKWKVKDEKKTCVLLVPPQVKSVGSAFPFLPAPARAHGHLERPAPVSPTAARPWWWSREALPSRALPSSPRWKSNGESLPHADTFIFTAAPLSTHKIILGETGSADHKKIIIIKMLGPLSGPHNGSVSCYFPKQVLNLASSLGYPSPRSSILLIAS